MLTIVSWDGHDINDGADYRSGFSPGAEWGLPDVRVQSLQRVGAWPVTTALEREPRTLSVFISIERCANVRTLRAQLLRWFDPEDETPKALIITDDDTGVERYVMATCQQMRPIIIGQTSAPDLFRADLVVDGDVRWRAVTPTTPAAWAITASGQTNTFANGGEDEAYPIIEITPTAAKTGGYSYKRYCLVTWNATNPGSNYPVRLGPLDTAALVVATKMLASGNDLRVFVDGVEVGRHLVDMDDANTYIWFSTSWQRAPVLELTANIAGAGTVDSIELDDEVEMALLPSTGFVRVNSEVFRYANRDLINRQLTGITREVWGTAAAAHAASDDVYWMQHEVVIVYGNAAAAAPSVAASEPLFTLATSSNTSWIYAYFGDDTYTNRPAAWTRWGNLTLSGVSGVYSATLRTMATPYSVAGAWISTQRGVAPGWHLYNPCGIVNAAWASGQRRAVDTAAFLCHLMYWLRDDSWWTWQATLAAPGAPNNWEAWSEAAAVADWDPADTLAIALYFYPSDVEVGAVTVTLNSDETPTTSIGNETGNYTLSATITNNETGEAITVELEMTLNETLQMDTDEHTATYLLDDSSQFQAVSLDTARRHWLRLLPGDNELEYTETGAAGVTVELSFEGRYY